MSLFENPLKELELYRELEEYVLKDIVNKISQQALKDLEDIYD